MAEVEDYTTRSRLTITHESVSDSDVEAYYRHRRYVARHPPQPPVEDAATAKIKELTATLDAAVEELHSTEGNIQSWVSKEDARHCREAAAAGRLDDLLRIKEERHAWPKYLTMVSWDIKNPTGQTALVLAVTNDHLDCVRFLIDQGADPNIVDGNGDSPLHLAKSQSVAELLLANGANPAAIDRLERTPYELHVSKRFHRVHNEIEGKDVSHEVHNAFEAHQKVRSKSRKGFKLNEEQRQKQQAKVEKQLVEEQAARDKAAHDAIVERGEALFNKAKGLIALKDPDSAVASLAECLSLDPHHPQALRQLRELAAGGNETARAALAHMLHPNEQRPWVAPDAAGSVIAMDAQLLLEAGSYARRFHPLLSILTEIYLCHTCSCHEILRMETPGQDLWLNGGRRDHRAEARLGLLRPVLAQARGLRPRARADRLSGGPDGCRRRRADLHGAPGVSILDAVHFD
jgi:hypothetical protein